MKALASARRSALGVSLIEALVALAVMAFGMLGVVGMQASLRNGADQSKQRSEALRLAQQKIEDLRSFDVLTGGATDNYAGITSSTATVKSSANAAYAANTIYTLTATLQPAPTPPTAAPLAETRRMNTVTVAVSWKDRESSTTGADDRSVVLNTTIAEISPELGAGVGAPTNRAPPRRPGGRHISIPPNAVVSGTGSVFTPPNSGGVVWTFSNDTGLIGRICPAPPSACSNDPFALLSGYIRFATSTFAAPTVADSENPTGLASSVGPGPVGVEVAFTRPVAPLVYSSPVTCFVSTPSVTDTLVEYFCAIPIGDTIGLSSVKYWDGESKVTGLPIVLPANDATDFGPGRFRVCRYTPDPTTDTPAGGNPAHPKLYNRVTESLNNQNFLVIAAGDGVSTVFTCPVETTLVSGSPLIDGDTKQHQP